MIKNQKVIRSETSVTDQHNIFPLTMNTSCNMNI